MAELANALLYVSMSLIVLLFTSITVSMILSLTSIEKYFPFVADSIRGLTNEFRMLAENIKLDIRGISITAEQPVGMGYDDLQKCIYVAKSKESGDTAVVLCDRHQREYITIHSDREGSKLPNEQRRQHTLLRVPVIVMDVTTSSDLTEVKRIVKSHAGSLVIVLYKLDGDTRARIQLGKSVLFVTLDTQTATV
jgi:hypothetical protein